MADQGLSAAKRAELVAHLAELDQMIEDQTAHVEAVLEMGLLAPVIALRLERLREVRRRYLSALKHLLGEDIGDAAPGIGR
jgi:hypothetical protein